MTAAATVEHQVLRVVDAARNLTEVYIYERREGALASLLPGDELRKVTRYGASARTKKKARSAC
jgi:hypothetical protein